MHYSAKDGRATWIRDSVSTGTIDPATFEEKRSANGVAGRDDEFLVTTEDYIADTDTSAATNPCPNGAGIVENFCALNQIKNLSQSTMRNVYLRVSLVEHPQLGTYPDALAPINADTVLASHTSTLGDVTMGVWYYGHLAPGATQSVWMQMNNRNNEDFYLQAEVFADDAACSSKTAEANPDWADRDDASCDGIDGDTSEKLLFVDATRGNDNTCAVGAFANDATTGKVGCGNGTLRRPYATVQAAFAASTASTQILVASVAGTTYGSTVYTNAGATGAAFFTLPEQVSLFGGYAAEDGFVTRDAAHRAVLRGTSVAARSLVLDVASGSQGDVARIVEGLRLEATDLPKATSAPAASTMVVRVVKGTTTPVVTLSAVDLIAGRGADAPDPPAAPGSALAGQTGLEGGHPEAAASISNVAAGGSACTTGVAQASFTSGAGGAGGPENTPGSDGGNASSGAIGGQGGASAGADAPPPTNASGAEAGAGGGNGFAGDPANDLLGTMSSSGVYSPPAPPSPSAAQRGTQGEPGAGGGGGGGGAFGSGFEGGGGGSGGAGGCGGDGGNAGYSGGGSFALVVYDATVQFANMTDGLVAVSLGGVGGDGQNGMNGGAGGAGGAGGSPGSAGTGSGAAGGSGGAGGGGGGGGGGHGGPSICYAYHGTAPADAPTCDLPASGASGGAGGVGGTDGTGSTSAESGVAGNAGDVQLLQLF